MHFLNKNSNLGAIFLLGIMFFLAIFSVRGDSGITDEIAHIPAGYSYLTQHDYRLNPEHPPLIKDLSAIPLLFLNLKFPLDYSAWKNEINGQWECGWQFIYHIGNNAEQVIFWSRIPIVLLSLILGIFIYKWTKDLYGKKTALLALLLFVFCPNIMAHSRYVTTDLGFCVFFFIAIYYFVKFVKVPSWKNLIISGVALGLVELTKFSAILLVPYLFLLTIVVIFVRKEKLNFSLPLARFFKPNWLKKSYIFIISLLLILIIGYLLVGVIYQGNMYKMPKDAQHSLIDASLSGDGYQNTRSILHKLTDNLITRPYAHYVLGLDMVFSHMKGGHSTYFLGETSNQGWWYFFIVAFLIKTPIAVLILVLISFVLFVLDIINDFKRQSTNQKEKNRWLGIINKVFDFIWRRFELFVMVTVILMFILAGMKSSLNIGLRYILPIYPFMFVLISKEIIDWVKRSNFKFYLKCGLVCLIVWYVMANIYIYPHYLAYFNELVGGPKNGYKYMIDSNLDWGQDLKRLAKWVDEQGIDKIKVDYFGGGVPEYYLGDKYIEWHSKEGETTGWLAVSATFFQMSKYYNKTQGEPDYKWLEKYKPEAIIGYSILVYNIE